MYLAKVKFQCVYFAFCCPCIFLYEFGFCKVHIFQFQLFSIDSFFQEQLSRRSHVKVVSLATDGLVHLVQIVVVVEMYQNTKIVVTNYPIKTRNQTRKGK